MRRVSSICVKAAIAAVGCVILFAAADVPGTAKSIRPAAAVTNLSKKGDRLPIASVRKLDARASSSGAPRTERKLPPLGCDPMFSPVAAPSQASLYRRCAA